MRKRKPSWRVSAWLIWADPPKPPKMYVYIRRLIS